MAQCSRSARYGTPQSRRPRPNRTSIIAVEVHVKAWATLRGGPEPRGPTNIRVVIADAGRPGSTRSSQVRSPRSGCGSRSRPKKRHNKRRLRECGTSSTCLPRLRQGAYPCDHRCCAGYASAIESVLANEPWLRADVVGGPRPACRPETRVRGRRDRGRPGGLGLLLST